jgi:hypothetical protein
LVFDAPLLSVMASAFTETPAHIWRAMRLFRSAILLLITLFSIGTPCAASEFDDRRKIGHVVQDAFEHERFAEISDLAERYRVEKSRTASGLWNLTILYASIIGAINNETAGSDTAPARRALDKKMARWTKLQPYSPTAQLAYADALMSRAWAISNEDDGPNMTPATSTLFDAKIEETRRYLEKIKSIAAVDPHWYEMMLTIARVQSWDAKKFGAMFDAAIAREPLFYQTWFVAADYLLPQWRPNTNDVELFAQMAAKKTAATEGTGMYARIYWYTSQTQFGDDIFKASLANWPKMKAAFDDVLARYPDDWNYNNYGKFACLAKDKKSTRKFFEKIGNQPMRQAWDTPGLIDTCRAWAMSGAI